MLNYLSSKMSNNNIRRFVVFICGYMIVLAKYQCVSIKGKEKLDLQEAYYKY